MVGPFDLSYDLIVLDESETLFRHFDEGTMNKTDNEKRALFVTEIPNHTKKLILMDGDVSQRTLSCCKLLWWHCIHQL